jgi:hypothetical protein
MEETAEFLYYESMEAILRRDFETAQLLLERARRKPGFSHEAEIAYTALLIREAVMRQQEIYRI